MMKTWDIFILNNGVRVFSFGTYEKLHSNSMSTKALEFDYFTSNRGTTYRYEKKPMTELQQMHLDRFMRRQNKK